MISVRLLPIPIPPSPARSGIAQIERKASPTSTSKARESRGHLTARYASGPGSVVIENAGVEVIVVRELRDRLAYAGPGGSAFSLCGQPACASPFRRLAGGWLLSRGLRDVGRVVRGDDDPGDYQHERRDLAEDGGRAVVQHHVQPQRLSGQVDQHCG
jgi:hypothetical protein